MPTLDDTATDVLGLGSLSRRMSSRPPVFGGTSSTISSHQRNALDNRVLAEAAELMKYQQSVNRYRDEITGRLQGRMLTAGLSRLNPEDPDFQRKRTDLLSQYPNGVLDDTAMRFLGLQDHQAAFIQRQRDAAQELARREQEDRDRYEFYGKRDEANRIEAEQKLFRDRLYKLTPPARQEALRTLDETSDPDAAIAAGLDIDGDIIAERELLEVVPPEKVESLRPVVEQYPANEAEGPPILVTKPVPREVSSAIKGEVVRAEKEEKNLRDQLDDLDRKYAKALAAIDELTFTVDPPEKWTEDEKLKYKRATDLANRYDGEINSTVARLEALTAAKSAVKPSPAPAQEEPEPEKPNSRTGYYN